MITITVEDYNNFSQEFYDSCIHSLQLHMLKCKCGRSACLSEHAYYQRGMATPSGIAMLSICRVKCSEFGHTHALLLSSMVPHSRVALSDQAEISRAVESGSDRNAVTVRNPSISIHQVKLIGRRYLRHWKQRLLSEKIPLAPLGRLVRECFAAYSAQFLQISRLPNVFFPAFT